MLGLYTLHSLGCYFVFEIDEDESSNSHVTGQLSPYQTLQSYELTTRYTCCGASKALTGFCWIRKQGRESPDTKVWAAARRPGRIRFSMSSCERAPVGAPTPPPPLLLLSPFSHPQWTMGVSHHDLVSPITKNPVASLKTLFHTQARKGLHQHSSQWCIKGKLEMTSCLKWTDTEQFVWSDLESLT